MSPKSSSLHNTCLNTTAAMLYQGAPLATIVAGTIPAKEMRGHDGFLESNIFHFPLASMPSTSLIAPNDLT